MIKTNTITSKLDQTSQKKMKRPREGTRVRGPLICLLKSPITTYAWRSYYAGGRGPGQSFAGAVNATLVSVSLYELYLLSF